MASVYFHISTNNHFVQGYMNNMDNILFVLMLEVDGEVGIRD